MITVIIYGKLLSFIALLWMASAGVFLLLLVNIDSKVTFNQVSEAFEKPFSTRSVARAPWYALSGGVTMVKRRLSPWQRSTWPRLTVSVSVWQLPVIRPSAANNSPRHDISPLTQTRKYICRNRIWTYAPERCLWCRSAFFLKLNDRACLICPLIHLRTHKAFKCVTDAASVSNRRQLHRWLIRLVSDGLLRPITSCLVIEFSGFSTAGSRPTGCRSTLLNANGSDHILVYNFKKASRVFCCWC